MNPFGIWAVPLCRWLVAGYYHACGICGRQIAKGQALLRLTSIHQPTNAHIISHKALLKHFKTL